MKAHIPAAALNQHIAILGKTGSGKTYAAKGIVEGLLHDKRQVCVLDPTGAWWGLRLGADGKSKGFDVVLLGGKHADIPLAERSGPAVARLVTEQGANVVIDTSGFSVGEYTRWFTDFAGTLYTTLRSPLHLVIDEAHYFAPQGKAPDPAAGKMIHACNRLMSGGRSLGLRGMLVTQRPAKLHKDSLTCADTLVAMRVIAPQDRQAIKDWIDGAGDAKQGREVLDSLAGLARGEGWVWYPEGNYLERTAFPRIATYDSSATPTHGAKAGPKVGEIDLAAVRAAMDSAVKEAEANDPKLLRQKIAELEKQLKERPKGEIDQAVVDRAVGAAIESERKAASQGIYERDRIIKHLVGKMGRAAVLLHVNGEAVPKAVYPEGKWQQAMPVLKPFTSQVKEKPAHKSAHKVAPIRESATGTQQIPALGKCERAILQALYWLRDETATPAKVGFYANYSANSGGFNNSLGKLRSAGLAQGWSITDAGASLAESMGVNPKPTGQELREWLRRKLGKAENAILDALFAAYPSRLTAIELGQASGYSSNSGGFNNALGRLRTIEAAEGYERDGGTKAADVFFAT